MQEFIYLGPERGSPLMIPINGRKLRTEAGEVFALDDEMMNNPIVQSLIDAGKGDFLPETPRFERVGGVEDSFEEVEELVEEESVAEPVVVQEMYSALSRKELYEIAKEQGINVWSNDSKAKIIEKMEAKQ